MTCTTGDLASSDDASHQGFIRGQRLGIGELMSSLAEKSRNTRSGLWRSTSRSKRNTPNCEPVPPMAASQNLKCALRIGLFQAMAHLASERSQLRIGGVRAQVSDAPKNTTFKRSPAVAARSNPSKLGGAATNRCERPVRTTSAAMSVQKLTTDRDVRNLWSVGGGVSDGADVAAISEGLKGGLPAHRLGIAPTVDADCFP